MDWVSVKGGPASGTKTGAGAAGGVEAQENIPGKMAARRSRALNDRIYIFTTI
ncbi:hypothetical protein FACS1894137_08480 [Spirochaetia bacterium]|nr:hypothetical protein FACS1894137_08480 [Spirochaetia bacterium]